MTYRLFRKTGSEKCDCHENKKATTTSTAPSAKRNNYAFAVARCKLMYFVQSVQFLIALSALLNDLHSNRCSRDVHEPMTF